MKGTAAMDVIVAGLIYRVRSFPRHHALRAKWRAYDAQILATAKGAAEVEL